MARSENTKPMIRILVFGAPGVGKNCLESRFTTGHWPPSYDSSLTLCSRRFYTFQYGPSSTSPGRWKNIAVSSPTLSHSESPTDVKTPFSTASTQVGSLSGSAGNSIHENGPAGPCRACLEKSQTHLIEIINYPRLRSARHRQQILSQGAYDAVLLVYSVGDRASYELIRHLHAEIPLRTQHKRRKVVPRKSSCLLSMFTPTLMDRKEATGVDHEAASKGTESERAVVAIVGNKCDLDGEVALDKQLAEKLQVEDIDYAMALFGLPSLRGDQSEPSATPSTSSSSKPRQHQHCPTLNLSNNSSEAIDVWLQVGKKNKIPEIVSPDQEVNKIDRKSSESPMITHSGRQVSHVDGEGLALELATQVPFFETSAKTGENVEELFEAIARAVLKDMGRGEVNHEDLTKKCQHRKCIAMTGPREAGSMAGVVAPVLDDLPFARVSASVVGPHDKHNDSLIQQVVVKDPCSGQTATCNKEYVEGGQQADRRRQQVRRRSSILGRMRILWKKESTIAESSAA